MILVFISSFQRGYIRRSGSNLFEQEKVFQISGVILATEQSIKSFTFIFLGFWLYFKPAFNIKILCMTFMMTLAEHLTMTASASLFYIAIIVTIIVNVISYDYVAID